MVPSVEVRRAIADLAEVRGRLASVQRFGGYSGAAAIASGIVALVAGLVQRALAPYPAGRAQDRTYLYVWLSCLVIALAINYGAILAWRARKHNALADVQIRDVGMTILPAIAAGGVITVGLVMRELYQLLPGMWCASYALGLFASRSHVPRAVVAVAVAFGLAATALLTVPGIDTLAWWVMPLAFGFGQIAIGAIVRRDTVSIYEGAP